MKKWQHQFRCKSLDKKSGAKSNRMKTLRKIWGVGVTAAVLSISAHAQGILTVTPGRSTASLAGTGTAGYSGDGSAASGAAVASPSAVAYDASGNLYLADTANHVVREVVKSSGNIITVAGTGTAGFSGDGGAATSAQLDTPTGIAVDANGNLYIADSHNHRIREVSGGNITTIAGTGLAGFAGDGGAATSAQLDLPKGIAVDGSGNIYIADSGNNRIRKISGTTISTIAGTGEQGYSGDGAAATAATLDSPTSVAVDASGAVYIADRHNQRVRAISSAGVISTVAGSGLPTFAGGFSGDGVSASSAALSHPTGVSVDAAGNIYIADTNNQRVRTVTGGVIATAAGSGEQGFSGDGGTLTAALLNAPKAASVDASGNLAIADTGNQRIRGAADAALAFDTSAVGVASATQAITLANTGTSDLTVSSAKITGPFAATNAGTCSATPITLAAGASCTEVLAFTPVQPGASSGSVAFSGPGAAPQTVLLSGTGTQGSSAIKLSSNTAAPFVNQDVTFTAAVAVAGAIPPTGTVSFYTNGALIGTAKALSNGSASLTTTFATAGTYPITASYSGDPNFTGVTSSALAQLVGDFSFSITTDPSQSNSQTVVPGQPVTYKLAAAPLNGPFSFPIALSATGLPPGATVTFSPSTLTLGPSSVPFTMTVQTSSKVAMQHPLLEDLTKTGPMLALLLLPFASATRRRARGMRPLLMVMLGILSLGTLLGITGCGTDSGFFGSSQKTYTINVIGTAVNAQGATLQRVAAVQLTLQ